jgi:predicted RNase H-like nuclease (RuvC/YqgF family)
MGAKSREVEEVEAKIYMLENKLKTIKSHLGSIEIVRQIDELKKERERLEKQGDNWIIG